MSIIEKFKLSGKKAFVTGGARGIGKAAAQAFAQAGADVAIVDINEELAQYTAEELKQYGVKSVAIKTDVTNPNEVQQMMECILKEFGTVDIAFNNAGIGGSSIKAEEMPYETWKRIIDVNLTGIFLTAQAAGKVMVKKNKGTIINTASMSAHIVNIPQPQCGYNAAKAGVLQLTKSLAVEWAPYNVRVNSISPGYIATEMTLSSSLVDKWKRYIPVKRMGKPSELQGALLYLASDASAYTTGTDIIIDGCYTCV